ncbi:ABC transporter permease [Hydrogenimonas thermophila]|uniref:Peptide/nickel transport system permease protein n=1 Tax=Hydrogenimonas thermophila TaxID=223786 RepID=A0A1I5P9H6_9BACT|nr:ABC transporter permease [Hydrogenimonas thermophila]SFP30759.1 peptide/nickel transport system permease protein [Hydrogenimonas thermophila]
MKLIFRKLIYICGMLLLISLISFLAIHAAPNSFFAAGELNPNITKESIEHLKAIYGLDKPLFEQYLHWVWALLHLDFGLSFASGKAVVDEIVSRLPITLTINLVSMFFVFFISLWLGIKAALKQQSLEDKAIKQLSLVSFAMPSFYLALLLILFLSLKLGWFPISGLQSIEPKEGIAKLIDQAWHLSLPIFVMVFGGIGGLTMYVRSLTLEILKSDYIFFAKARGIDDKTVRKKFIMPNLMPSIITILGLSLPGLIGGSVIIESIFSINGMGLLFYQSALSRDYPVIMGILIITAFLTLLGNVLADLILAKLNPYFKDKSL